MSLHMVVAGNPVDGIRLVGPFDDTEAASFNMEVDGDDPWWFAELDNRFVDNRWDLPLIQFARLIAEVESIGGFTNQLTQDLQTAMDLGIVELHELIDRAQEVWDECKARE